MVADADESDLRVATGAYKPYKGDLLGSLDFDLNVNSQFMFNARRWFAAYHEETERFDVANQPACSSTI